MKIRKYSSFLVEKLDFDDIKERLDDSYIDLKSELIEMIEETLKNIKNAEITMTDLEDFINDYISAGKDANMIDKLVEDNDIFNFYLKFQSEIDELLNDTKYMDESPSNNNVFSLYDVVIDGTKQSILDILESIKDKLFKKIILFNMDIENEKRIKKLKERIEIAKRMSNISDDMGDNVFESRWLLKNIVGLSDKEIEEMEKTNPDF